MATTVDTFIWTDLSTYDIDQAQTDYSTLFAWSYTSDGDYHYATRAGMEVAALFTMPDRFAAMEMPSFWMSYVQVASAALTVEQARRHPGAIIEVEPKSFGEGARIALIRDPSGAGFTVYDGPDIPQPKRGPGTVVDRYHHVFDMARIKPFYQDLFGWSFQSGTDDPWQTFDAISRDGSRIATIEEVPETITGQFNYWMPCFELDRTLTVEKLVGQIEGSYFAELSNGRHLVADRQGAHFMLRSNAG